MVNYVHYIYIILSVTMIKKLAMESTLRNILLIQRYLGSSITTPRDVRRKTHV